MEYDYLQHWGVKGMRWGVRRYQNKDGSLTPRGKKRYSKEMDKLKEEDKVLRNKLATKAKIQKLEDKRKSVEEKKDALGETVEAKKERILASRSAKELYENADLFTTNELNAAYLRLNLERNIKNLEPATVSKGETFVSNMIKAGDTTSRVLETGSRVYNNVAKIYNSMLGNSNGKTLPLIDGAKTNKLEKYKEQTAWMEAKNARKQAEKNGREKEKTALDRLNEETKRLNAENANRKAKQTRDELDEIERKRKKKED